MNIKWEKIKSEEQLKSDTLMGISIEKEGGDIVAVHLSFKDGRCIKICKSSDYSKFLNIFIKEPNNIKKEITYVKGKNNNGYIVEAKATSIEEEQNILDEFTNLGYEVWTEKEEKEVAVDIFSREEMDEIPF